MVYKKKKNDTIDELTSYINKYKVFVSFYVCSISFSFWLGTYYEEVKKNREITEIENKHQMDLLEQKETYMDKYFDLRDKYLNSTNDSIYENKKHK